MKEIKQGVQISVIIPVYNAEMFLKRCLDSLTAQKKENIEFICINDGSIDRSWEILNEYAEKDIRFRIFKKENGGVSTARNLGLDKAIGKYIMFLDSDDWYEADTCEKAYALIDENDADVALFCMDMEYAEHSEYKNILGSERIEFDANECKELHRRCIGLVGDECRELRKFDYLSVLYLKIYRKDIIDINNIRFVDIKKTGSFEDGLFNIEYFTHIRSAVYTPDSLYHYNRCNESSITTRYREQLPEQWKHLFAILDKHVASQEEARCRQALNNRIAYAIFPLGLNVVSGDIPARVKHGKIRQLLKSQEIYKAFTYSEIMKMPMAFKVFFLLAKWKWSLALYWLLNLMQLVRDKNKGLKK